MREIAPKINLELTGLPHAVFSHLLRYGSNISVKTFLKTEQKPINIKQRELGYHCDFLEEELHDKISKIVSLVSIEKLINLVKDFH